MYLIYGSGLFNPSLLTQNFLPWLTICHQHITIYTCKEDSMFLAREHESQEKNILLH